MSNNDGIGAEMSLNNALTEVKRLQVRVDDLERHILELHATIYFILQGEVNEHINIKDLLSGRIDCHRRVSFVSDKVDN